MISGRNILCLSTPPWESDYASTTVQLMRELAQQNQVLFVQNPFTTKDVFDGMRGRKKVPLKKVFGLQHRIKTINYSAGAVHILTPPPVATIQFLQKNSLYHLLLKRNGQRLLSSVKRALHKLQMEENLVVVVSLNPGLGLQLAGELNESLLLYLCYDDITGATYMKKHGAWQEEAFTKKVDATVVTSEGLFDRKKHLSQKTYIVKNAADFNLFSQGFNAGAIGSKKIGFIGGIDRRIDYDLLHYCIESLPDYTFHFIGRTTNFEAEAKLRTYKNVVLEGAKPVTALPGFASQFAAGIIPFLCNDFLTMVYPLKLNEYLAAGLPVVSTAFSKLDEFDGVARIVRGKEAFLQTLLEEVNNDSPEKKQARQNFARQNTWAARAEIFSEVIQSVEGEKQKP